MSGSWSNTETNLIILVEQVSGLSGIFGYSPVPGTGNLVFSVTAAAGTDPYGNTYAPGLNVGNQQAAHFGVDLAGQVYVFNSSDVRTFFVQSSTGDVTIGATTGPHFKFDTVANTLTFFDGSGTAIDVIGGSSGAILQVSSTVFTQLVDGFVELGAIVAGSPDVTNAAGLQYVSATNPFLEVASPLKPASSFTDNGLMLLFPGFAAQGQTWPNLPTATFVDNLASSAENIFISGSVSKVSLDGSTPFEWQTPSSLGGTGWAQGPSSGSSQNLRYRLGPNDNLEIIGTIHTTSATPTNPVLTLPAGYRPAQDQRPGCYSQTGLAATARFVQITTAGAVNLFALPAATNTDVGIYVDVPMGNVPGI